MIKDKFWDDIAQSVSFELVASGRGTIEDAAWRVSGFSRPYHVIIYIEHGGFSLNVNYSAETLVMHEGDWAYIPAGVCRQNAPVPKNSKTVLHFCNFNSHIFDHFDFLSFFELPVILKSQVVNRLKNTVKDLDSIHNDKKAGSISKSFEKQSLGMHLLSGLLTETKVKPHFLKLASGADRFSRVFDFISQNYHRKVSLNELASIACLSVSAFHKTFKESVGVPPLHFIRRQRINEARRLLFTTDLSLGNIADKLGFSDQFSFSKCFKKVCGQSPREYRRTARKEFGEI